MIAKVKIYKVNRSNWEDLKAVFKKHITWKDDKFYPQRGLTVMIPHYTNMGVIINKLRFKFFITDIVYDLRNSTGERIILIDKRRIRTNYGAADVTIEKLKQELSNKGWIEVDEDNEDNENNDFITRNDMEVE